MREKTYDCALLLPLALPPDLPPVILAEFGLEDWKLEISFGCGCELLMKAQELGDEGDGNG